MFECHDCPRQPPPLKALRYVDDDGDTIAIDSDESLHEAAAYARSKGHRLAVTCDKCRIRPLVNRV